MSNYKIISRNSRNEIVDGSVVVAADSERAALEFYADAMDYGTADEMIEWISRAGCNGTIAAVATDDPAAYTA